jgi:hypothetical protein
MHHDQDPSTVERELLADRSPGRTVDRDGGRPAGPSRRRATLGVMAGLVAGGAIGFVAAAPTFSSAATPEIAQDTTEGSTGDAATDDATDDDITGNDVASDDIVDASPGDRMRALLQPLVDDGTIDASQADAVASHLAEHRPERDHGPRRRHPGFDGEVIAELIGIEADDLRDQLRAGASIADVAQSNGVDPQAVVDALVDEAEAHLDLAVESGRLTTEEAAERAEQLEERVTARVNGERPSHPATN